MAKAVSIQFDKAQAKELAKLNKIAPTILEKHLTFAFVGITENLSGEMRRRLPVDTGALVNSVTSKVAGFGLNKSAIIFPASPADKYAPIVEKRKKDPSKTRSRSPRNGQWQWRTVRTKVAPQVVNRALDVAAKRTAEDIARQITGNVGF